MPSGGAREGAGRPRRKHFCSVCAGMGVKTEMIGIKSTSGYNYRCPKAGEHARMRIGPPQKTGARSKPGSAAKQPRDALGRFKRKLGRKKKKK